MGDAVVRGVRVGYGPLAAQSGSKGRGLPLLFLRRVAFDNADVDFGRVYAVRHGGGKEVKTLSTSGDLDPTMK